MAEGSNTLGEYLRARRGLVTPEQAGIPLFGTRRVPGLRREEVAMLSGLSADYYVRLERGKDRNPSVQVLESIARVLMLDAEHFAYLLSLTADKPRTRRRPTRKESVPAGILTMVASLPHPAFVEGRYFDVLAVNPAASVLSPRLVVGRNQLKDWFLDAEEQSLHLGWDDSTECLVANLRRSVGTDIDDPRFIELTGELCLASPRFRKLWARHDVKEQFGAPMTFNHPQVGEMTLNRERLTIDGTAGLHLVVFHPEAGSEAEQKLSLLTSLATPSSLTLRNVT